jgi:hypothetical protein
VTSAAMEPCQSTTVPNTSNASTLGALFMREILACYEAFVKQATHTEIAGS